MRPHAGASTSRRRFLRFSPGGAVAGATALSGCAPQVSTGVKSSGDTITMMVKNDDITPDLVKQAQKDTGVTIKRVDYDITGLIAMITVGNPPDLVRGVGATDAGRPHPADRPDRPARLRRRDVDLRPQVTAPATGVTAIPDLPPASLPCPAPPRMTFRISTSFDAEGLPKGLHIDTASGVGSGTAGDNVGSFTATVSATNSVGTATQTVTFTIEHA
jgi:hypothetical protein